MPIKAYRVLTKRHLALAVMAVFLTALAVIVAAALIPYAYANAVAAKRKLPIYCTDRADKVVSLTFDAAWGDADTEELIAILDRYQVKATFFVVGEWVDRCGDSVRALSEAGHEIMNHSDTHPNMPRLSREKMVQEINACNDKIQAITGKRPDLFRAPYGDYDNALLETVETMQMYCLQWDVDSLDWKDYGVDSIVNTVCSNKHLGNGSIILCHNGAKFTADALDTLITNLKGQGYEIVPISELIYRDGYHMDAEGRQVRDK